MGGLGFKDFYSLKWALLVKQFWRLLKGSRNLWAQILIAKYVGVLIFSTKKRSVLGVWQASYKEGICLKSFVCGMWGMGRR